MKYGLLTFVLYLNRSTQNILGIARHDTSFHVTVSWLSALRLLFDILFWQQAWNFALYAPTWEVLFTKKVRSRGRSGLPTNCRYGVLETVSIMPKGLSIDVSHKEISFLVNSASLIGSWERCWYEKLSCCWRNIYRYCMYRFSDRVHAYKKYSEIRREKEKNSSLRWKNGKSLTTTIDEHSSKLDFRAKCFPFKKRLWNSFCSVKIINKYISAPIVERTGKERQEV